MNNRAMAGVSLRFNDRVSEPGKVGSGVGMKIRLVILTVGIAAMTAPGLASFSALTDLVSMLPMVPRESVMHVGMRMGLDWATWLGDDPDPGGYDGTDYRLGMNIGGYLNIKVGKMLSIEPEVLYIQKGIKYYPANLIRIYKLDYADISVLTRFSPGWFSFFAGPSLGILLNAEAVERNASTVTTTALSKQVAHTDLGLAVGLGFWIPDGVNRTYIDMRATFGVLPVPSGTGESSFYNATLSTQVGFMF
jgi:hypothetical protein